MTESTAPWRRMTDDVYLLSRARVNCYLIVAGDGLTLIDAGLPAMWADLVVLLRAVGATPDDIDAVLLTHGHFDHVGMSRRLLRDHGVAHHVHDLDRRLARHPYRYRHAAPRWVYPVRHPRAIPTLARIAGAGALWVKGVDAQPDVVPGQAMDVPGNPVPVFSPGHTDGHCAYLLPQRGVIFTGDALVTLDPYTGGRGARIVADAATADADAALASLDQLADTRARRLFPGHGDEWTDGIDTAVAHARRIGRS
jgi:glyoxylase-like metal-dependent hydrolase (beta-lactamase superfamily II)